MNSFQASKMVDIVRDKVGIVLKGIKVFYKENSAHLWGGNAVERDSGLVLDSDSCVMSEILP